MRKNIKHGIAIIVIIISIIGIGSIVYGDSTPTYSPYGAYIPEGIKWGYVEYQIQKGDTVSDITEDFITKYPLIETFIGFEHQMDEIIRVNGLKNPDRINEGGWLIIPIVSENPIENKID